MPTKRCCRNSASAEGLDKPLHEQFFRYVGDVLHGDFGESMGRNRSALDMVLEAYPVTLQLAVITMTLVLICACAVGALAAYKPGGIFDRHCDGQLAGDRQLARFLGSDHHAILLFCQ